MAKLTFKHPRTGETYSRNTDQSYTHVSIKNGDIRWHGSEAAAQRRGGEVFPLKAQQSVPGGFKTCPNCLGEKTITMQTATQGMVTIPCAHCHGDGMVKKLY